MTNIIDRARDLLTCDELRGRVPEEVRQFLRDVVALEPVAILEITHGGPCSPDVEFELLIDEFDHGYHGKPIILYPLGAPNDPA